MKRHGKKLNFQKPEFFDLLIQMIKKFQLMTLLTFAFVPGAGLGLALYWHFQVIPEASVQEASISEAEPTPVVLPFSIGKKETLSDALKGHGFGPKDINLVVEAAKPYRNLNRVRPGIPFLVQMDGDRPSFLRMQFSATEFLEVRRDGEVWTGSSIDEKVDIELVTFSAPVETSLWESASAANMDGRLIAELTDVFAWQIDFSREVRPTDRWRLTVERKLVRGKPVGWGDIIAAEYQTTDNVYTAFLHRQDGDKKGYFDITGKSLRRMFLKSPINFARITSKFQMHRFHPIFKEKRPHMGVDYGAPYGTPVKSVGDGVVEFVGWRGGGGKTVVIRHNSVYKTAYKHLSNYAAKLRPGQKVSQGQVIAYVGNTGYATGPHLHFEFYQSGRYVDPLGKSFPSADPVPKGELVAFQQEAKRAESTLPPWPQN